MPGILRLQRLESENDPEFTPEITSNNGGDENQSSEGDPDARSIVELRSDEFPLYFIERRARLFSSNPSPYPLPVDTPEQEVAVLLVLIKLS